MERACEGCQYHRGEVCHLLTEGTPRLVVETCPVFEETLGRIVSRTVHRGVPPEREDLGQEVRAHLLRLERWPLWEAGTLPDFFRWLTVVARNLAVDWRRKYGGAARRRCPACEHREGETCSHPDVDTSAIDPAAGCDHFAPRRGRCLRLTDELLSCIRRRESAGTMNRYCREVQEVVTVSLSRLASRDGEALRRARLMVAHYLEGVTLDALAREERVSRASIKRQRREAREHLRLVIENDMGLKCADILQTATW